MDTYIVLSCGHEFHYECLEKFVIESTSNLCPNCGKNVKISIKQNKNKRKEYSIFQYRWGGELRKDNDPIV